MTAREYRKEFFAYGIQKILEEESSYSSDYYSKALKDWRGETIQYDDIKLILFGL